MSEKKGEGKKNNFQLLINFNERLINDWKLSITNHEIELTGSSRIESRSCTKASRVLSTLCCLAVCKMQSHTVAKLNRCVFEFDSVGGYRYIYVEDPHALTEVPT